MNANEILNTLLGPDPLAERSKRLAKVHSLEVRIRFEFAGSNQLAIVDAVSFKDACVKAREFISENDLNSREILSIYVYNGKRRCASISYNANIVNLL